MNVAAYWLSDRFAIRASRAQPVSEEQAPELYKIVRELSERYQLPMPRVYMIPSEQPNAFATGRNAKHAAVAVTQGLMSLMPEDQIRGVLAHEFGHIRNRDILVSSVAAMIAGAISAIGNIFLWTSLFGGGDDDDSPLGGIAALLIILQRCCSSESRASASTSPTPLPLECWARASPSPMRSRPWSGHRRPPRRCRSTRPRPRSTSSIRSEARVCRTSSTRIRPFQSGFGGSRSTTPLRASTTAR